MEKKEGILLCSAIIKCKKNLRSARAQPCVVILTNPFQSADLKSCLQRKGEWDGHIVSTLNYVMPKHSYRLRIILTILLIIESTIVQKKKKTEIWLHSIQHQC